MIEEKAVNQVNDEAEQKRHPSMAHSARREQTEDQHSQHEPKRDAGNHAVAKNAVGAAIKQQQQQTDAIQEVGQPIQREAAD